MPIFVIQHHLATADHYDVRLEIDGVLVSWAVPKGPSLDPHERRLARRVDDHDLAHADFEGVHGRPRADLRGTVQIWDRGTFTMRRGDATAGLERGHLSVALDGVKLHGGWSLLRTGQGVDWLLVKKRDVHAVPGSDVTTERPESAVTGRTLAEIARG